MPKIEVNKNKHRNLFIILTVFLVFSASVILTSVILLSRSTIDNNKAAVRCIQAIPVCNNGADPIKVSTDVNLCPVYSCNPVAVTQAVCNSIPVCPDGVSLISSQNKTTTSNTGAVLCPRNFYCLNATLTTVPGDIVCTQSIPLCTQGEKLVTNLVNGCPVYTCELPTVTLTPTAPISTVVVTETNTIVPSTTSVPTTVISTSVIYSGSPSVTPSVIPTTTIASNCICGTDNKCSNSCSSDSTSGLSCQRESALGNNVNATDKNSYCNRSQRTKGDADGDGVVNNIDYFYYVKSVSGGEIPGVVNPDFNGDGFVSATDRLAIVNTLNPN